MNVSKNILDKIFVLLMWLIALALVFIVVVKFKILFH
jgi:hypothetical protein